MTADDTYTVQFRLAGGATALMHGSCAIGGQFLMSSKVTGRAGTAWLQGEEVGVDTGDGPCAREPLPTSCSDRPIRPVRPPPHGLRHVAFDGHRPRALHARLRGHARPDPRPRGRPRPGGATFADGVAVQAAMGRDPSFRADATWESVEPA